MIAMSGPTDGLEVSRNDLSKAIRTVAHLLEKWNQGVTLRFENGWLFIEAGHGHAVAKAPARGRWPLTIVVDTSWVRRLGKSLPAGDPIRLRVEDRRLYANRYSVRCSWTSDESPFSPEAPRLDQKGLIDEAAKLLKPLRIKREELENLVSETRAKGPSHWSFQEKKMIGLIAKAWALLAPFGIEPVDIRRLADNAVRNAWK